MSQGEGKKGRRKITKTVREGGRGEGMLRVPKKLSVSRGGRKRGGGRSQWGGDQRIFRESSTPAQLGAPEMRKRDMANREQNGFSLFDQTTKGIRRCQILKDWG